MAPFYGCAKGGKEKTRCLVQADETGGAAPGFLLPRGVGVYSHGGFLSPAAKLAVAADGQVDASQSSGGGRKRSRCARNCVLLDAN